MNENIKELLSSIHPIFRIPGIKIFWCDTVMKKNTHKSLQPRLLVIASPGIFLLERKTFPKGYSVSRIIPYSELVLITADSESMQFYKAKVTMVLQHPKYLQLVAMVCTIRSVLFGEKLRSPKLMFDPAVAQEIEKSDFIFETDTLLADRFLSLCLEIPQNELIVDQICDIYEVLKTTKKSFTLTNETISSVLMTPLAQAIAYDDEIKSLQIKNVKFSAFIEHFTQIAIYNSSLQRITFNMVSFDNCKLQDYINVLNQKTAFSVSQFSFLNCQLVSSEFGAFLKTFVFYTVDIQSLFVIHCNMDKAMIESLLNTISSSSCFKSINELYFSGLKGNEIIDSSFIQFFNSDYFVDQKSLHSLTMIDFKLNLQHILTSILSRKTPLISVDFSQNFITNGPKINDFSQIEEINFSKSTFTANALLSFFQSLATLPHSPRRITLDSLQMNEQDWTDFLIKAQTITAQNIVMLSLSGNSMKAQRFQLLAQFMMKMPKLSEIGISDVIQSNDANESLRYLTELVDKKAIRKIDIKGYGNHIIGAKMVPLLQILLQKSQIRMLDISGQDIGRAGLEMIEQLANKCLEELRFDGNLTNSPEFVLPFLTRIVSSQKLKHSEWPEVDSRSCIAKSSLSTRAQVSKQLEKLKTQFLQKFEVFHTEAEDREEERHTGRRRSNSILQRRIEDDQIMLSGPPQIDTNILSFRIDVVESALCECFGEKELHNDPLISALEKLEKETSVSTFLEQYRHSA